MTCFEVKFGIEFKLGIRIRVRVRILVGMVWVRVKRMGNRLCLWKSHKERSTRACICVCVLFSCIHTVKTNLLTKLHFQETALTIETCGSNNLVVNLHSTSHSLKTRRLRVTTNQQLPPPQHIFPFGSIASYLHLPSSGSHTESSAVFTPAERRDRFLPWQQIRFQISHHSMCFCIPNVHRGAQC